MNIYNIHIHIHTFKLLQTFLYKRILLLLSLLLLSSYHNDTVSKVREADTESLICKCLFERTTFDGAMVGRRMHVELRKHFKLIYVYMFVYFRKRIFAHSSRLLGNVECTSTTMLCAISGINVSHGNICCACIHTTKLIQLS